MRKVIQYQMPNYQTVPDDFQTNTIRQWQGVNTFDAYMIPDNQLTDMSNMTSDDYPAISVRPGYTKLGASIGTKVLGLGVWKDAQLHAVFNDGTWRYWDGSAWQTVMSGLSTTADATFTNFQGNQSDICLWMANGVNGLKRWNGTTGVAFGDAPSDLNYITTYANRLWGASGKELHGSALDQPDEWNLFNGDDEDSYVKDMESTRGENINMLSGSLTKLTVGMPNSIHELYGSVPSDFNTRLLTEDEGFSNNKSATTQGGIMRFIHEVGIFDYAGGTIPDKTFSEIVRTYFTTIDSESAAGSDGRRLYFRVDDSKILMYDPRTGVESWSVWDGIEASQFALMQNQLYIGDATGSVFRFDSTTDNGTAISWSMTTKPFNNSSMAQKSRWVKLWVSVELASGSTVDVLLSPTADGDDFVSATSITGTGLNIQRVMVPLVNFQYNEIVRVKLQGTGWARIHELTFQNRLIPLY